MIDNIFSINKINKFIIRLIIFVNNFYKYDLDYIRNKYNFDSHNLFLKHFKNNYKKIILFSSLESEQLFINIFNINFEFLLEEYGKDYPIKILLFFISKKKFIFNYCYKFKLHDKEHCKCKIKVKSINNLTIESFIFILNNNIKKNSQKDYDSESILLNKNMNYQNNDILKNFNNLEIASLNLGSKYYKKNYIMDHDLKKLSSKNILFNNSHKLLNLNNNQEISDNFYMSNKINKSNKKNINNDYNAQFSTDSINLNEINDKLISNSEFFKLSNSLSPKSILISSETTSSKSLKLKNLNFENDNKLNSIKIESEDFKIKLSESEILKTSDSNLLISEKSKEYNNLIDIEQNLKLNSITNEIKSTIVDPSVLNKIYDSKINNDDLDYISDSTSTSISDSTSISQIFFYNYKKNNDLIVINNKEDIFKYIDIIIKFLKINNNILMNKEYDITDIIIKIKKYIKNNYSVELSLKFDRLYQKIILVHTISNTDDMNDFYDLIKQINNFRNLL